MKRVDADRKWVLRLKQTLMVALTVITSGVLVLALAAVRYPWPSSIWDARVYARRNAFQKDVYAMYGALAQEVEPYLETLDGFMDYWEWRHQWMTAPEGQKPPAPAAFGRLTPRDVRWYTGIKGSWEEAGGLKKTLLSLLEAVFRSETASDNADQYARQMREQFDKYRKEVRPGWVDLDRRAKEVAMALEAYEKLPEAQWDFPARPGPYTHSCVRARFFALEIVILSLALFVAPVTGAVLFARRMGKRYRGFLRAEAGGAGSAARSQEQESGKDE